MFSVAVPSLKDRRYTITSSIATVALLSHLLVAAYLVFISASLQAAPDKTHVEDEVLVRFEPGVVDLHIANFEAQFDLTPIQKFPHIQAH
jgi:hypothetical protein